MTPKEPYKFSDEYYNTQKTIKRLCYLGIGILATTSILVASAIVYTQEKERTIIEDKIKKLGGYSLEIKVGEFADIIDATRFRYVGTNIKNKEFEIQQEEGIDLITKKYQVNTSELVINSDRYQIREVNSKMLRVKYLGKR